LGNIYIAWRAPDLSPVQMEAKLSPGIPRQSVDNPPVLQRKIDTWKTPDPFIQPPRYLAQGTVVVAGDSVTVNFAWIFGVLATWKAPDPLPQLPRKLSPGIPGQSVDNPPTFTRKIDLNAAWKAPDPFVQPQRILVQGTVNVAGDTVLTTFPWLMGILTAWRPVDPAPTIPRKLSPGIPGMSVDKPPQTTRAPDPVDPAWFKPFELPTLPKKLSPGIPGQSVDRPPNFVRKIDMEPWRQTVPPVQRQTFRVQGAAVVSGNPPSAPGWFASVISAWMVKDGMPQQMRRMNPALITGSITPRFLLLGEIDAAPSLTGKVDSAIVGLLGVVDSGPNLSGLS
jgi:hypothetical protein